MAIKEKDLSRRLEIDLKGPDGNAWALMGYASRLAKQLGKDEPAIVKRMQSGDYESLLKVFDEEFGDYVDLVR